MIAPSNSNLALCEYCGKENREGSISCAGCGTILVATSDAKPKKSKPLAIFLVLMFGPLGLLYVGAWGVMVVALAIGIAFFVTDTAVPLVMVGGRIICAVYAYYVLKADDDSEATDNEALELLDDAAELERHDRAKAIAAYEDIISKYPGSSASKEAARNIKTLSNQR